MLQEMMKKNYLRKGAYYIVRINKGADIESSHNWTRLKENDLVIAQWEPCDCCDDEPCNGNFFVEANGNFIYKVNEADTVVWNLLTKENGEPITKLD